VRTTGDQWWLEGPNFSYDTRSGVANEGLKEGIPAIAFSADGGTQHSFTEPDPVADLYAQVALKVVQAVTASKPFLPNGTALVRLVNSLPTLPSNSHINIHCTHAQNVNFPKSDPTTCTKVSDFSFILSRVNIDLNPFSPDVEHCGTSHLPTESDVIKSGNCRASISVFKDFKIDANAAQQKVVRDKISSLLTCLPAS
jgi:5'-nucleotidase